LILENEDGKSENIILNKIVGNNNIKNGLYNGVCVSNFDLLTQNNLNRKVFFKYFNINIF